MLACLILALSFGTIGALQLVAMNYLHNLNPDHSPYEPGQRAYKAGEIVLGGVIWSLASGIAATAMWAIGYVLADAYSFALCTLILLNIFTTYQSLEYFYAALARKFSRN